jgi:hypothetical protein
MPDTSSWREPPLLSAELTQGETSALLCALLYPLVSILANPYCTVVEAWKSRAGFILFGKVWVRGTSFCQKNMRGTLLLCLLQIYYQGFSKCTTSPPVVISKLRLNLEEKLPNQTSLLLQPVERRRLHRRRRGGATRLRSVRSPLRHQLPDRSWENQLNPSSLNVLHWKLKYKIIRNQSVFLYCQIYLHTDRWKQSKLYLQRWSLIDSLSSSYCGELCSYEEKGFI